MYRSIFQNDNVKGPKPWNNGSISMRNNFHACVSLSWPGVDFTEWLQPLSQQLMLWHYITPSKQFHKERMLSKLKAVQWNIRVLFFWDKLTLAHPKDFHWFDKIRTLWWPNFHNMSHNLGTVILDRYMGTSSDMVF